MKTKLFQFSFILCVAILFSSCDKEPITDNPNQGNPPPPASNVNVYVVGSEDTGGVMHAKLWKNGEETILDNGTEDTYARDVFVSGGNVHVVGHVVTEVDNVTVFRVKYWLNGVAQDLVTDTIYAVDIPEGNITMRKKIMEQAGAVFVSGNDVYIAVTRQVVITEFGSVLSDNTYCKYLKNGESINMGLGRSTDITVSGNDVYVSGLKNNFAAYWKNGIDTFLTDGSIGNSGATGIVVQGGDVYVSGYENHGGQLKAKMWLNGNETILTTGTYSEEARSIVVSANDVYICGFEHTVSGGSKSAAKYWKNGTATMLTDGEASKDIAHSIAVHGQDVFVSGEAKPTATAADRIKYWKNAIETTLNSNNTNIGGKTSIFIEPI